MQRRIGLAQALINEPELILLDEPTSGLDPIGTAEIKDLIRELRARGKTIVLSGHLLADMQDICDRIAILHRGELKEMGQVSDLLTVQDVTQIRRATSRRRLARGPGRHRPPRGRAPGRRPPDDDPRRAVPADRPRERPAPGRRRVASDGKAAVATRSRRPGRRASPEATTHRSPAAPPLRWAWALSQITPETGVPPPPRDQVSLVRDDRPCRHGGRFSILLIIPTSSRLGSASGKSPADVRALIDALVGQARRCGSRPGSGGCWSSASRGTRSPVAGGLITWVKAVGLLCLVAWVGSWIVTALKERRAARARPARRRRPGRLVGGLLSVLLAVAQSQEKARPWWCRQPVATLPGIACAAVLVAWVETTLWSGILWLGKGPT
jgi:hypothetical protein